MLLCQFLVLAGNRQFFVAAGKFYYDQKKKRYSRLSGGCAIIITTGKKIDTVVCLAGCAVVLVFGSGGKFAVFLSWWESFITTEKIKIQSSV